MSARENLNESLQDSGSRFGLILTQPITRIRRSLNDWIATRTPRVAGPWSISRRRVYIVPTRYGYGYGLLLFVMLLGAMNYSNSMAFLLTFLLTGIGLLAMHYTHGNLVNLRVGALTVEPVFAGHTAQFIITLENPTAAARYALSVAWQDQLPEAHADVATGERKSLCLALPATQRGWLPAARFAVSTEFPVGLFHAWTWVELDLACLVYPRPAVVGMQPPASTGGDGSKGGMRPGPEEFAGLRSYQPGDPLRAIHWKSLAKNPSTMVRPMVKQFAEALNDELWLDWATLPASWSVEQRLSQLTRWLIDADNAQRAFGLRLPGFNREPAIGALHREDCLRALALFQA